MFSDNFYPTPLDVIEKMLDGELIKGKVVLEPSAGKGDIVDYLLNEQAAEVLAVELHADLRAILSTKCSLIGKDFLLLESHSISHIHLIVMNPPFEEEDKHILHAFEIAPPGCRIISLCNYGSYDNMRSKSKSRLRQVVHEHGSIEDLGACFSRAERQTDVQVGLIKLQKPGGDPTNEFEGFFLFEEEEQQATGLMPYNAVRDLVNRYVEAVRIYTEYLNVAVRINAIAHGYFHLDEALMIEPANSNTKRNEFKKQLQKSGWNYIFRKLNLEKYATKGLREDINRFVETQLQIPFTMRNIYRMLEVVAATTTQRMDKAILEVFDRITAHYHENRFNLEGWKTNSHYLVGYKFILPYMCYQDQRFYKGEDRIQTNVGGNWELIEDLVKALCYINGDDYEAMGNLRNWISHAYKVVTDKQVYFQHGVENWGGQAAKAEELHQQGIAYRLIHHQPIYGQWFDWAYFRVKAFKKGSMHFEFKDRDVWARFNQRIARLKGYPLFEGKEQTAYQKRQAGYTSSKA